MCHFKAAQSELWGLIILPTAAHFYLVRACTSYQQSNAMADPISGIATVGVVASIIQLLEFTGNVGRQTHEILASTQGTLKANEALEQLVSEYDKISAKICNDVDGTRPLTLGDAELDNVARNCTGEAEDLLKQLQDLKLDRWYSWRKANVARNWKGCQSCHRQAYDRDEAPKPIRIEQPAFNPVAGSLQKRALRYALKFSPATRCQPQSYVRCYCPMQRCYSSCRRQTTEA